ncbi:MAG: hypothetical protein QG574_4392 [Cyanobacteriota bacterium erpe_2018_sw_21hr_WHONDRS-SW48-000092_B_bin.40]|jgi:hypothetical protein|nr:hypothetical protein [Cyanobacteriota bacterium erpe_2018_sw_21hr_WHONDRS-SW48-000092_B_bin.40]
MYKNLKSDHESTALTFSTEDSVKARYAIFDLLKTYQGTEGEKERSLGLFIRGSLLARILATAEIYKEIVEIPGIILDLGTWRGQTAVLCENFRAIYEPLNFNRRIVCFDTFEGYQGFCSKDKPTELHREETYSLTKSYADFLSDLLVLHEQSNAMGHNNHKHKVVTGDCRETLPGFFADNPNELVALAFFDLNCYEPTQAAFEAVFERLVTGGILAFWQLTRDSVPAEASFYAQEVMNNSAYPHKLKKVSIYPGLCYLQKV